MATIEEVSGGGVFQQTGSVYTLNLGTIGQNTILSPIELDVLNDVSGPSTCCPATLPFNLVRVRPDRLRPVLRPGGRSGSARTRQSPVSSANTGVFTETVTPTPTGLNRQRLQSGHLQNTETLTITADIIPCFWQESMIPDGSRRSPGRSLEDRRPRDHPGRPAETHPAGRTGPRAGDAAKSLRRVSPVIVRRGALGDHVPDRDLWHVTRRHALPDRRRAGASGASGSTVSRYLGRPPTRHRVLPCRTQRPRHVDREWRAGGESATTVPANCSK